MTKKEDGAVVHHIDEVLLNAIKNDASDIHFEPYENIYRVRIRIDGLLHEVKTFSKNLANYITTRLKILAGLDISEKRLPQDGRFLFKVSDTKVINFRMNTCPTLHGEKIVLRILELSTDLLQVDALGMSDQQTSVFVKNIHRSQGLVLVTGPTGSGKTVTLYTALRDLNTAEKNISTIEDPIEMQLHGANQVQVNQKSGMLFSTALRAFLRQDPDIIMVGEMRDRETAEICVKAAQTGHLVLSTLHTNSAADTLVRLENMGIATYNIASSVSLIIAQRLVRKLCDNCKKPINLPPSTLIKAGFKDLDDITLFEHQSCEKCHQGYQGRLGIYEVMPISGGMKRLILASGNAIELADQARKENIVSLRMSGLEKVKKGLTSLSEVNRMTEV